MNKKERQAEHQRSSLGFLTADISDQLPPDPAAGPSLEPGQTLPSFRGLRQAFHFPTATWKVVNAVSISVGVVFTYSRGGSRERPQDRDRACKHPEPWGKHTTKSRLCFLKATGQTHKY